MSMYWKVEITPYEGNEWNDDNTVVITNLRKPLVTLRHGDALGTFEFRMSNVRDKYLSAFKIRSRLIIRRAKKWEDIDEDESVIIIGVIRNLPVSKNTSKDELVVEGHNFMDVLSNALTFGDYTNVPINEALQQAIASINSYIDNPDVIANQFAITWNENNPTLNIDGNPYPVVGELLRNRPFRYLVNKYSTANATGTVRHFSFVDKDNTFVWRPVSDDVSYTFGDDDPFINLQKDIDVDGIVNLAIVKGGYDIYNKQIQYRYSDLASQNKYGQKTLFIPTIAQNAQVLNQADMLSIDEPSRFPFPTAGASFTTTWISSVTGDYVTVTSNEEYNDALRAHIIEELKEEGRRVVQDRTFGIFTLKLEFKPGTKPWFIADLIDVNLTGLVEPGVGFTKLLRVTEASYSHTRDSFELREDMGTV